MALTAALKAQIAAWYKALQDQIPDFIPRAPQRQMIADVARTLAGEEGRHLAIEAPTGVGKTLSYLIPGIAIAREEQALASSEPTQQDLLAFLDDELTPNNQEEQKRCARLKGDLDGYKWDGLRDHTDIAIDDDLRRWKVKPYCRNQSICCWYWMKVIICPMSRAMRWR